MALCRERKHPDRPSIVDEGVSIPTITLSSVLPRDFCSPLNFVGEQHELRGFDVPSLGVEHQVSVRDH